MTIDILLLGLIIILAFAIAYALIVSSIKAKMWLDSIIAVISNKLADLFFVGGFLLLLILPEETVKFYLRLGLIVKILAYIYTFYIYVIKTPKGDPTTSWPGNELL